MNFYADFLRSVTPIRPPFWVRGGNMETIYAKSLQGVVPDYRRELIADSYGEDVAAYDFIDAENDNAPCVILLHGLEGSSRSHYAIELMRAVQAAGWHGCVAHFRSCGGVASRRLYHSGDTREVAHMLNTLAQRYATLYVVGVSLGGNVLAKYLGEQGADTPVQAACVVSSPVNLQVSGRELERGLPYLLYTPYFLSTLMRKIPADVPQPTHKIRSLGAFDNAYTAPIHGFADKDDYYTRASAWPYLPKISVPTLLLNAQNDPFFPATYLPTVRDVSPSVCLLQPTHGGHCGFVSGTGRGHLRWLPETLLSFFQFHQRDKLHERPQSL